MPEKPLTPVEKLKAIVGLLGDNVTKKDFLHSFKNVVALCIKMDKGMNDKMDKHFNDLKKLFVDLKATNLRDISQLKSNFIDRIERALADQAAGMNFIRDKVRNLKDGYTPIKGKDYFDGEPGTNGSPDTALQVRDKLESLKGNERIDVASIRGLEKLITESQKQGKEVRIVPGGPRGMFIYIGGVKKGIISNINFVGGTGMAIAFSMVNGQPTLTFNSSGGGSTVSTPPEIPDGSIVDFTVSAEPKWVVADGTTYYAGAGYTYNSGTGKVTMDIAPSSFIRYII